MACLLADASQKARDSLEYRTPKSLLLGERSNDGAVSLRRRAETMSGVHCDAWADGGRRTGVIAETKTAPAIPRRRCHTRDAICCEYL